MELPARIAVLVDAILLKCPQYDRVSVTVALESVFAGHPTLLGGNSISMLLGQNNDFRNATITIGSVHAGHTITVQLPQPIDPLPAALAVLASIPLNDVPTPRSDLPHASRMPFESSPHFVGREDELKRLAAAIGTAQPAVVMPAVATGLGGIGKTSLVTEFAYRYGVYFHGGVFWLNCADPDQVASQIAACALDVGIDPTGMAVDEQVQRVLNAWKSPMPRLLIFDNCEDRAILDQWKPTIGGCRVLITAQSDQWPTLTQIRLGLLSPAESRDLLQRLCTRLDDAEADAIASDLGHLPLALHLAGSYLATYPHQSVEQYRKDLTIAHRSLKGRGALRSPTRHNLDVEATFMLSFRQLDPNDTLDALALAMLDGAAWCAPGVSIPRALVLAFVPDGTESDDAVDALRRLQQLGLLDGTDAVVLHRLLTQVVQARLGSTDMLAVVEDRTFALAMHGSDRRCPLLTSHLRHGMLRAINHHRAMASQLMYALGCDEHARGLYESALAWYHHALAQPQYADARVGANESPILEQIAHIRLLQGDAHEARRLLEQAFVLGKAHNGLLHARSASTLNRLAIVAEQGDEPGDADAFATLALAIRQHLFGLDHLVTAESIENVAGMLAGVGDRDRAKPLYEQVYRIRAMQLGALHPRTLKTLRCLAYMAAETDSREAAVGYYTDLLGRIQQSLGHRHPWRVQSLIELGNVLFRQQEFRHAQSTYEEARRVQTTLGGPDDPQVLAILELIAQSQVEQEAYREAQHLLAYVVSVRERDCGSMHLLTGQALHSLGWALLHQGEKAAGLVYFERAFAISTSTLGSQHPFTTMIQSTIMGINESDPPR